MSNSLLGESAGSASGRSTTDGPPSCGGGIDMKITRRDHLAVVGSALLATGPLAGGANAQDRHDDGDAEVLYGHGLVWNRALPGVASDVKLAFDLRVNL